MHPAPRTPPTPSQLLEQGQRAFSRHEYERATSFFSDLALQHPLAPEARLALRCAIQSAYHQKDWDQALMWSEHFLRVHPHRADSDQVTYWQGMIYRHMADHTLRTLLHLDPASRDLSHMQQAQVHFETLAHTDSAYAERAQQALREIHVTLAAHHLEVAQHYLTRKAYVAALQRAWEVVHHFPDTPSADKARAVLDACHTALHIPNLSQDV